MLVKISEGFGVAANFDARHDSFVTGHPLADKLPRLWDLVFAHTTDEDGIFQIDLPPAPLPEKDGVTVQAPNHAAFTVRLSPSGTQADMRICTGDPAAGRHESFALLNEPHAGEDRMMTAFYNWMMENCPPERMAELCDDMDMAAQYLQASILQRHESDTDVPADAAGLSGPAPLR